jgi:signal transduction histidine kinase
LTIIRGELELLLERPSLETRTADALRRALSGIKRLDVLSNDLLLLARLDGEPERMIFKSTRLDELLLDSISDLSLVSRQKDIVWQIDIPEAVEVECNRHTLDRAVRNVLENAIKYSPEGSSVSVMLLDDGVDVRLTIADNGVGIPAGDLPKVFDRFYRSDSTRTTEGTGLGLAIVKSVVEAHNGYVTLTSSRDAGTTVVLSIPAKQRR